MSDDTFTGEQISRQDQMEPVPPVAGATPTPLHRSLLARYGLLGALFVAIVVFCIARPDSFATIDNLKSVLTQSSLPLIIAAGLTIVLVMEDFDLSFGSMIGLGSAVAVALMVKSGVSWPIALLAALAAGLIVGAVNGFIIAYLGGSSFIITLAMGTILSGLEFAITGQSTLYEGISHSYSAIAQNTILGFSNEIWIAAAIALLVWMLLDFTELGRYMYAIGGNPEAARLAGIRTKALRLSGFMLVGLAAAICGVLLSSQTQSFNPNSGAQYLLPAFAAVFLGSAVFRPGQFNLPGTVVGVLFLGVIQTGLTMLSLQTYMINLVQGAILIAAVMMSRIGQRAT
jgi:ribose transport system permease protein